MVACLVSASVDADADADDDFSDKKHHKHHKHHKGKKKKAALVLSNETAVSNMTAVVVESTGSNATAVDGPPVAEPVVFKMDAETKSTHSTSAVMDKMRNLEKELGEHEKHEAEKKTYMGQMSKGSLQVNGPLPADFNERFQQAVAQATGCDPQDVKVLEASPVVSLMQAKMQDVNLVEVVFEAPADVVKSVEEQAADPDSKLANGAMHAFLVEDDSHAADHDDHVVEMNHQDSDAAVTPIDESAIDIDTQMPYGELEPFGREDTAQELTESSVHESDEMVDQLERAEVAEEKRAVFRALTRLRGAAITSFDGIARSQTGNIDEYNKVHKWRKTHPLHHLADEESDITKWAFPDNAD
jgi:hypothetical protein